MPLPSTDVELKSELLFFSLSIISQVSDTQPLNIDLIDFSLNLYLITILTVVMY